MTDARRLQRIADVYGLVERMRSVDLSLAAGLLAEAEEQRREEILVRTAEVGRGRAALALGDSVGWMIGEAERCASDARLERLGVVQRQRMSSYELAREAHNASRLEAEQMQLVLKGARDEQALVEGRRVQAESDDRFASRRCWEESKKMSIREKQ